MGFGVHPALGVEATGALGLALGPAIAKAARRTSNVGGSLRDVQFLAGHSSLQTTQRYIEGDTQAQVKIVDLM